MVADLKTIAKYQLKAAASEPLGIFFTILLPSLLFGFFGLTFGLSADRNIEYAQFVLPGMIGVMCSSDALYMVGPMVRAYLTQGLVREFKGLPLWTGHLFLGFAATRLTFVLLSMACLLALSATLFAYVPTASDVGRIFVGAGMAFVTYALVAVGVSLLANSAMGDYGFGSLYYFTGMFLCDAFFVLSERNPFLNAISFAFPLKPALLFMRGDDWAALMLLGWTLAGLALVVLVLRKKRPIAPGRER